jgi:ribonuclease HI
VFWGADHPDNVSAPIQGNATNNRAEYFAAINAMEKAQTKGYPALVIRTDSNLMIKSVLLK